MFVTFNIASVLHFIIVNCYDPDAPNNGSVIDNYDHTREGATVTYLCDDGFRPSQQMTSNCTSSGNWVPLPQEHMCTFVTGKS